MKGYEGCSRFDILRAIFNEGHREGGSALAKVVKF